MRGDVRALAISGTAAPWNTMRRDRRTRLAPGAFTADLHEQGTVPIWLDHDEDLILGAVRALGVGAHRLVAYHYGLSFSLQLQPGPVADALELAVQRHRITGCSIGLMSGYTTRADLLQGGVCETITRAEIKEISILTADRPAYPRTALQIRRVAGDWALGWAAGIAGTTPAAAILDHLAMRRAA
jgi:HK97 family phage prohead protease